MEITLNKTDKEYYDRFPSGPHKTGDIWTNIPTNGLLPFKTANAVVITPGCDLQNNKTDTLLFLLISPIYSAIHSGSLKRELSSKMTELAKDVLANSNAEAITAINFESVESRVDLRNKLDALEGNSVTIQAKIDRLLHWLTFCDSEPTLENKASLEFLKTKDRDKIYERLVKNSFNSEYHFLPKERVLNSYPILLDHSLCLLRYAISYPVQVFDLAFDCTETTWPSRVEEETSFGAQFASAFPVRGISLVDSMTVSLLSRFLSLHSRIGSKDFSNSCVDSIRKEISCTDI